MKTASQVLEQKKNTVERSTGLTREEKKLLKNDYIHEIRNSKKIESGHTLGKHISKLRMISEYNKDLDLSSLENPEGKLSKKIRDQIQSSDYKKDKGDYRKRNKNDYWLTWKYLLTQFYDVDEEDLPDASFSSNDEQADIQADTRPEDLPTASQMRELLRTIRQVSDKKTFLRNQAVYVLIWSIGTRKGETFPIKMKDVDLRDDKLRIYIHGNKESGDEWVRVWQGEQLLRKWIQQHPKRADGQAYLFPNNYYNKYHEMASNSRIVTKMRQAKNAAGLDFKDYGEPFHIFRKSMVTFHKINEILDWEGICKKQRKDPDSTKPDYLIQAMQDIEKKEAEAYGVEQEQEPEGRMIGQPLMPQKCKNCGRKNTCIAQSCVECSGDLEQNQMPKNMDEQKEGLVDIDISAKVGAKAAMNPDKSINEIKEEVLEEHGN